MEKDSKMLQKRLVQLEMLLSQATKIQNQLFQKLPKDDKEALTKNFEEFSKLSEEYSKICTVLNSDDMRSEKASISKEYASVKELLLDLSPAELSLKITDRGSCWTSCETCVTACIKCVTDIGLSPGSGCGLSSLIYSPCRPKIDIGEQDFSVEVEDMFIKWKEE